MGETEQNKDIEHKRQMIAAEIKEFHNELQRTAITEVVEKYFRLDTEELEKSEYKEITKQEFDLDKTRKLCSKHVVPVRKLKDAVTSCSNFKYVIEVTGNIKERKDVDIITAIFEETFFDLPDGSTIVQTGKHIVGDISINFKGYTFKLGKSQYGVVKSIYTLEQYGMEPNVKESHIQLNKLYKEHFPFNVDYDELKTQRIDKIIYGGESAKRLIEMDILPNDPYDLVADGILDISKLKEIGIGEYLIDNTYNKKVNGVNYTIQVDASIEYKALQVVEYKNEVIAYSEKPVYLVILNIIGENDKLEQADRRCVVRVLSGSINFDEALKEFEEYITNGNQGIFTTI